MIKEFNLRQAMQYLCDGKHVPEDVLPTTTKLLDREEIYEAINKGSELSYDEISDELSFVNSDGDKLICPDLSSGLSLSANWLTSYLPSLTFDIDQGGNVRKSLEVEALYKMICLCYCIKDFSNDFKKYLLSYDFKDMAPIDGKSGLSMSAYVQSIQSLNSARVNSIFSAAAIKLADYREKNESFYTGLLAPEEISKLESLRRTIKSIISRYEKDYGLNPNNIKDMTKIMKLERIQSRDQEIEKEIEASDVAMLYKISKLSSERIPVVLKSKIFLEAENAGEKEIKANGLTGIDATDYKKRVKQKIINESYRAVLKTIRYKEIESYKNDPSSYKLKTKS